MNVYKKNVIEEDTKITLAIQSEELKRTLACVDITTAFKFLSDIWSDHPYTRDSNKGR